MAPIPTPCLVLLLLLLPQLVTFTAVLSLFGSPGTNTYSSPLCMAPIHHPYRRAPHLRQTNSLVPECSVRGAGNANPSQITDNTECITPERCVGLTAAFSSSQI
ncbi:hypothetical protein BDP55DRAFT_85441 [Colletotrichum godetiae]|uniref:Uncharacterized protein n=1 Tax=Colletotrichum godetiae TaxID=1209918 RepID=A0AAJ0AQ89_9PEZI|nr:uncharacterized protein BDP55DRAFT_85441 [Colletotrichum godetiae]KAK1687743.1 hypothetical protein BDP55DRAFT_85441 [Colletotrichum godetiae]